MARKPPTLKPIQRGGVALPFLTLPFQTSDFNMTFCEPTVVGRVFEVLQQLPMEPYVKPMLEHLFIPNTFVVKLKPFTPGTDDPIEWVAAELAWNIQAGILMDQVPEFERLTDKQRLAQLDELDTAWSRFDDAFGQLRYDTWDEIISVNPDLPPSPTIAREGIYNLYRGFHDAVREARRRLKEASTSRGRKPNGPAIRAYQEAATVYNWITGKKAKVHWNQATGKNEGACLPFLREIFDIFGIEGDPAHYAEKDE
jgi:hypothetical protein